MTRNSYIPSKDWMNLARYSKQYIEGVESFLDFAYSYGDPQGEEIQCPCAKCCNIRWTRRNVVYDHLICYGFVKGYTRWINHGEWDIKLNVNDDMDYSRDDIDGLLNDQFRDVAQAKGCLHGWRNESFTSLLELLKEAMPELNIPPSYNKTKSMVKNLDLDYEKIDACSNDCMLFRNDHKDDEFCHTCGASRYIKSLEVDSELEPSKKQHRVSAKTLKHFPLIPLLKRLFMCSKTVDSLRWHDKERSKEGKLRHPTDGLEWKDFDMLQPYFALDCRNVRLGLSSDGFNPFQTMSISHSTWPDSGVETYDGSRKQTFQMRAALMWTINDFHAYAMLSGWSTKGKFACPFCNYGTNSHYLKHSRKMCYMDHRVFLPMDHPWRSNKRSFNEKTEFRPPPPFLKGTDVLNILHDFENVIGKKRKRSNDGPWEKMSIFFELPYWQHNLLRHNLDDHAKARYDLKDMGIRKNLHPKDTEDSKRTKFAKVCFSMTNGEKSIFCGVLRTAKLPDGSASNISRFNRRARNNDECAPSDAETVSFFPNKGVPLGAKKTDPFILDDKSLSQAHAYLLGNCDEVQEYIRQRDASRKTQNSGVTLGASITIFASSKDKNLIAADLTYYGRIVNIVELDYYGHFKVVLFKCDWYEVENDAYDPYDQDRHYVIKTVPIDLFNMSDEVESNLPQGYENEPSEHLMGPSIPKDNGEVLLTRTDVLETIIDVPSEEFVTQRLEVEYEEEFEDEFANEFEDESENEYEDESKNEYENEFEDEFEDEFEEKFEDDAP
ncbi:hypothetical protein KY284_003944 [Solanum tuberosum]|nr:hypothetical protein KY284_003944 [Solanum tuberosum]